MKHALTVVLHITWFQIMRHFFPIDFALVELATLVMLRLFRFLELARRQFPLFPVKWLLKDTYNSVAYAPGINSRTLILLAEQDEIIGRARSEALYQAFTPGVATLKSYSGSHNSDLAASQIAAWLATAP